MVENIVLQEILQNHLFSLNLLKEQLKVTKLFVLKMCTAFYNTEKYKRTRRHSTNTDECTKQNMIMYAYTFALTFRVLIHDQGRRYSSKKVSLKKQYLWDRVLDK